MTVRELTCRNCGSAFRYSRPGPAPHHCGNECRLALRRSYYAANPPPRKPRPSAAERLAKRLTKRDSGCIEWGGYRTRHGYGQIQVGDRLQLTHRFAWELANGPIPSGLNVCHHCDNPPCCNPDHLFLGTQADNAADMKSKGRGSGPVKIPDAHVREIRRRYRVFTIPGKAGEFSNADELADEFGISRGHVQMLAHHKYRKAVA